MQIATAAHNAVVLLMSYDPADLSVVVLVLGPWSWTSSPC